MKTYPLEGDLQRRATAPPWGLMLGGAGERGAQLHPRAFFCVNGTFIFSPTFKELQNIHITGAGVVAQWPEPALAVLASHTGAPVLAVPCLVQLSADAPRHLPSVWETWMGLWASGFDLAQPWPLWMFRE